MCRRPFDFNTCGTGGGWANWNSNGSFVTLYIQESIQQGIIPVFTYYMLLQSAPGESAWGGTT